MQRHPENTTPVFHLFVITVPDHEDFIRYMAENDVECNMHYPVPCHLQKAYANLRYPLFYFCPHGILHNIHSLCLSVGIAQIDHSGDLILPHLREQRQGHAVCGQIFRIGTVSRLIAQIGISLL